MSNQMQDTPAAYRCLVVLPAFRSSVVLIPSPIIRCEDFDSTRAWQRWIVVVMPSGWYSCGVVRSEWGRPKDSVYDVRRSRSLQELVSELPPGNGASQCEASPEPWTLD